MIHLQVDSAGKFFTPEPGEWGAVTIEQCEAIMEVVKRFPKEELELYAILSEKQTPEQVDRLQAHLAGMPDKMLVKTLPALYGEIILILAQGLDSVDTWPPDTRRTYYNRHCLPFVHGLTTGMPADSKPFLEDGFWVGQEFLEIPKARDVMGKKVPMDKTTALEFTEAADLQVAAMGVSGEFSHVRLVLAIVCRPKGEAYDEGKSLDRAERMGKVTMDVVWSIFFSLIRRSYLSERSRAMSSRGSRMQKPSGLLGARVFRGMDGGR
jgi:hypothetical protein